MMAYNRAGFRGNSRKFHRKAPVQVTPYFERDWSALQLSIFSFIENSDDNAVIMARAGSGKSTTLEGVIRRLLARVTGNVLVVAFNRSIADEMTARLAGTAAVVSTCHSLGYKACKKVFKSGAPDQMKVYRIIASIIGDSPEKAEYAELLKDCISKSKFALAWEADEIDDVIDRYALDVGEGAERNEFITNVQKALRICKEQTKVIDYDDMIWLPIVHNLTLTKYPVVCVDETQDLNKCQLQLVIRSLARDGRIIACGDDKQAIYTFMGADESSIPMIIDSLKAKVLPLNETYRCPKKVVELANEIVPDLKALPDAPEGIVEEASFETMLDRVRPGDFILSRTNAPLISICLKLIKQGIPANIKGAEFSRGLLWMVKKSMAKTVSAFLEYLADWRRSEIERLTAKGRDISWVNDKADCLEAFCADAQTIDDIKKNIRRMFDDEDSRGRVTLSSTHKAKGLEADRVFMLAPTYKKEQGGEEANLYYVAVTRAKKELYLVKETR